MLTGIRRCCCRSKRRRVSPCWPASNPPHACNRGRNRWSAQGTVGHPVTPPKGETSHRLYSWRTPPTLQHLQGFLGSSHHVGFDRQPRGRVRSRKAVEVTALPWPLPQFHISECADSQTAVTYQDIVLAWHKAVRISARPFGFCQFPLAVSLNSKACTPTAGINAQKYIIQSSLTILRFISASLCRRFIYWLMNGRLVVLYPGCWLAQPP